MPGTHVSIIRMDSTQHLAELRNILWGRVTRLECDEYTEADKNADLSEIEEIVKELERRADETLEAMVAMFNGPDVA